MKRKERNRLEGVLFDLDGTLIDSGKYIHSAFSHTLNQHGILDVSSQAISAVMGMTLEKCYLTLAPNTNQTALLETHRAFQLKNSDHIQPFSQVPELLAKIQKKGLFTGIVTSRHRDSTIKILKYTKLYPYINVIVGSEDAKKHKPEPEPIVNALTLLGISPKKAMYIGDMDVDVQAGKAAQTLTVGVTYGLYGESIVDHNPDFVVNANSELNKLIFYLRSRQ